MTEFAAFTEICEEDACWIGQYLNEVERLQIPFAVHFDRCSEDLKSRMRRHRLCVGSIHQDYPVEYTEQHKQAVFDLLINLRAWSWIIQWNIDELFEKETAAKLQTIARRHRDCDSVLVKWVNCWGDLKHVRVDTVFKQSMRHKLYNISGGRRWRFDHPITHGCKLFDDKTGVVHDSRIKSLHSDLVCLHTGLMTKELRELHKARWDRIYTTAVGNNPYGFWDYCLNEVDYPPTIIENPYR